MGPLELFTTKCYYHDGQFSGRIIACYFTNHTEKSVKNIKNLEIEGLQKLPKNKCKKYT